MSTQPITLLVHSKVNTSDWCLGTAGAWLGCYKVITLVTKSLQCGEQWQVMWSVSSLIPTGAATWRSFQFWWHTIQLWRWKRCSWCWWTLYFFLFFLSCSRLDSFVLLGQSGFKNSPRMQRCCDYNHPGGETTMWTPHSQRLWGKLTTIASTSTNVVHIMLCASYNLCKTCWTNSVFFVTMWHKYQTSK